MQVFRLVKPGVVDRMIAFDSLPENLLTGIRRGPVDGLPRHWKTFLGIDKNAQGTQPFYILEFMDVNADKTRWQEISQYVRRAVDLDFRLMDHIEDMAVPMAPDSNSQLTLDVDDIPVIPIPKADDKKEIPEPKTKARIGA